MKWLGVFGLAVSLGGLGTLAVARSGPGRTAVPVGVPSDMLSLPQAPFSDWVQLGWSQDVSGRWVVNGYRMDAEPVDVLAEIVMRDWAASGRGGRVVPLEDGGAFLSSVDLSAGDQVTYLIEDRGGVRTMLVGRTDFSARPTQGQPHIGPAVGGFAGGSTAKIQQGFHQAVEAKRQELRQAGWKAIAESDDEQRRQGRHSETWKLGHQLKQIDHVKTEAGEVFAREQQLPAQEALP